MKRYIVIVLLVMVVSLATTNLVFAQGIQPPNTTTIEIANLFTWAKSEPPNWGLGALYAGLGFVGALVTLFVLIGGAVPGTAGKAKIEEDSQRLKRLTESWEKLVEAPKPEQAVLIGNIGDQLDKIRDDLRRDMWIQFSIGFVLYAILGAFFSMLLAQDILQAIVMGAGWTSVIGTLGLKKDFEVRKDTKDNITERALARAQELENKLKEKGAWDEKWGFEDLKSLAKDAEAAKAL